MNRQLKTLPQVTIEIDGSPLELSERAALSEVRVQQRLSLPALCEITFIDTTGFLSAGERFSAGAELSVRINGFDDALFKGQITAVEYLYEPSSLKKIRLRGYDKLHLLRKHQSVRAFVQMSLRDLIAELTSDFSLECRNERKHAVA